MITYCHLVTTLLIFLLTEGSEIEVTNSNPTGVVFHYETHRQLPFNGADGH